MPQSLWNYVWVSCRHHIPWRAIACVFYFSDATCIFSFIRDGYTSLKTPLLSNFNLFHFIHIDLLNRMDFLVDGKF